VRIGLNEDCWLGINGVQTTDGGAKYRQAVVDYVNTLRWDRIYAIVDLHWSAPGSNKATALRPMPDVDHSLEFWRSVATAFVDNPNVMFDVYNEPFGVDWDCWRDGCEYPAGPDGGAWQTAGMQALIDTIRDAGARQPILVGGLWFANDARQWLDHKPEDSLNQLIAAVHIYPFNRCSGASCWDDEICSADRLRTSGCHRIRHRLDSAARRRHGRDNRPPQPGSASSRHETHRARKHFHMAAPDELEDQVVLASAEPVNRLRRRRVVGRAIRQRDSA
jgi:hypothetical protein